MKKQLLLIVLALSISVGTWAQKSSVKLQVGYGVPLAGSSLSRNSSQSGSNYSSSIVSGSLGSGFTLEAGYTYSFAPLISAQVDFTYLAGKEYNSTQTASVFLQTDSYSGNFFQMAPLIRFDVGEGQIHPYAAVGPAFGFGSMKLKHYEDNDGGTLDEEEKYSGSVAIGTKSVLGLELSKGNVGFYVQATMVNMSYAPSKSEITKYISNGTDMLAQMQTYQKVTEYKDSISSNGQFDPTQPSQQLFNYFPLSSISLSIGARLKF
jgi:hypothetical protein